MKVRVKYLDAESTQTIDLKEEFSISDMDLESNPFKVEDLILYLRMKEQERNRVIEYLQLVNNGKILSSEQDLKEGELYICVIKYGAVIPDQKEYESKLKNDYLKSLLKYNFSPNYIQLVALTGDESLDGVTFSKCVIDSRYRIYLDLRLAQPDSNEWFSQLFKLTRQFKYPLAGISLPTNVDLTNIDIIDKLKEFADNDLELLDFRDCHPKLQSLIIKNGEYFRPLLCPPDHFLGLQYHRWDKAAKTIIESNLKSEYDLNKFNDITIDDAINIFHLCYRNFDITIGSIKYMIKTNQIE